MKLSGSNIGKFLVFSYISGNGSPEKNSLYFKKWKPRNGTFLYFRKQSFLIFLKNGTLRAQKLKTTHSKKMSYILENGTFYRQYLKTSYISGENFKAPSLKKKFLYVFLIF